MKALKWSGAKGKVELVEVATDMSTQEDSVIIKVMFSGVCGSDLLLLVKKMDAVDGVIPGHEIAGVIEKVGTKVTNLQPGDKVVVMPQGYCGKCRNCLRGQVKYCIRYDYVGFEINGGWAEYCQLPAYQVYKLPETLELKHGLLCQPYSCVAVGWDNNGVVQDDAQILVMRAGIIGLFWACLFHHHGHKDVTITELSPQRRTIAQGLELGFTICHPDRIMEKFSSCQAELDGFDVIVDATGSPKALSDALQWLRRGGKLNIFGCCPKDAKMTINPIEIMQKELTVIGTIFNPFRFPSTVGLVAGMPLKYLSYEKMGIKIYAIEDYQDAFDDLRSGRISKAVFEINKI